MTDNELVHEPIEDTWTLVYKRDGVLVLSAACTCGDDDHCSYTATIYVPKMTIRNVIN